MTTLAIDPARPRRSRAAELAAATPSSRDRFVDLVRAVSIVAVVLGHWLMAVPAWPPGRSTNALAEMPGLAVLTWVLQVMPLFFVVGGYANARSIDAVHRKGGSWADYLAARVRRLVRPTALFVIAWAGLATAGSLLGGPGELLQGVARSIAQPLWFLGVYLAVVALAPVMLRLHRRFGIAVPVALATGAVLVDVARLDPGSVHGIPVGLGLSFLGPLNFLFVWLFAHQLGFLYADGRMTAWSRPRLLALAGGGLAALVALTTSAVYPASMVGMPGEPFSNMNPPSACIVALTIWLTGLAMLARPALSRWLARPRAWAAVVAANSTIMTVYLWHLTAMIAAVAILFPLGFPTPDAGTGAWWALRPVWVAACAVLLLGFVRVLGPAERAGLTRTGAGRLGATGAVLALTSALALAVGLLGVAGAGLDVLGPERIATVAGLKIDQVSALGWCAAGMAAALAAGRVRRRA